MRTTLTLDPDVADFLKTTAHNAQKPFKQVVNKTLRLGIHGSPRSQKASKKLSITPHKSGIQPAIDPLKLNQLVDEFETQGFLDKASVTNR